MAKILAFPAVRGPDSEGPNPSKKRIQKNGLDAEEKAFLDLKYKYFIDRLEKETKLVKGVKILKMRDFVQFMNEFGKDFPSESISILDVNLCARIMSLCVIASVCIFPGCCVAITIATPGWRPSRSSVIRESLAAVLPTDGINS